MKTNIVERYNTLMPFIDNYGVLENKLDILNESFPELLKKSILQETVQGKRKARTARP